MHVIKKGACFLTGVISLSVKYKVYNKINLKPNGLIGSISHEKATDYSNYIQCVTN